MIKYINTRLKQLSTYCFGRYDVKWGLEVNKHLKPLELLIFHNMGRYDKIHSFELLQRVKENELLGNDELYKKLALLHDCGKDNLSILWRTCNVLRGRKSSVTHCEDGFKRLKDINIELATLVKTHHNKTEDEKMLEFQRLDSE